MKMIDKVFEELKRQGVVPTMEDFGIMFKYQMTNYLCLIDKEDEEYFNMYVPSIFEVSEENEHEVLKAINKVNNSIKVVKLTINGDSVWIGFEEELPKDADVADVVPYAITGLFRARQQFYEALKEV